LCQLEDIDPESGKEVRLQSSGISRYIAIFRAGDMVHAYVNTCPHQGRSLSWAADRFLFEADGSLVCPHHGARFEITTGVCLSGPCEGAGLTPVEVLIEDGLVMLVKDAWS
jgi:nitrite reductase/ring-hydroxylating ferredoxin subunit